MAAAGGGPEEGVGESSSPPRDPAPAPAASGGSGRGGGLRGICREVFDRLVANGHAAGPELRAQLEAHFARLPTSYQLDVNVDKAEDVLIHQKVLAEAKDPDSRPAFAVRFLRLEEVNVDETTNSDAHEEGADIGEELSTRSKTSYTHIHEILFSTTDKPKLLSQLSALLSDIGLNIREAHVFSTTDGYSLDVFVVDGWPIEDTDGLHKALEASILRNEGSWSGSESSASGKSLSFLAQDCESDIDTRLLKIVKKVASGCCRDMFPGTYSGEEVAVKVLNPDNLNQSACNESRQEIHMLREVDQPNIVRFIGSCTKPPGAILDQTGGNILDLDFGKCTGTSYYNGRAYIHYWHFIIQRLCKEQDHLECLFDEEGPTPVLQLTFHHQFSCDIEWCLDLDTYFRKKSPVRFIQNDKLIEESDSAKGFLSNAGQKFLASLLRIVQANLMLGFSMGPSLERKDVLVSGTTGECMLLSAKCFRRDKSVTAPRISYSTAANFFESLLEDTEGHDILDKLCESVRDLLSKMRSNSEPGHFKSSLMQELILYHPAIMGTEGYIHLMRKADELLRRQFKYAGSMLERQVSSKVLSNLPYLSAELDDYWAHTAERHRMLAHWYNFRVNSSKGYACNNLTAAMHKARSIKSGKEASFKLEKAGSGLVALHRDAVNHPFEEALKRINGMENIWPVNMENIVDVLRVNYSMYPVCLLENISEFGHGIWDKFTLDMCFPRKPQSNEVWNTKIYGLHALMMKVGRRFK